MKKLFLFAAVLALAACSNHTEVTPDVETVTIRFGGFDFQEEPLITRTDVDVATIVSRLDMWFVAGDDVTEVHQSSADDGFGTVTLTLNKTKTYTVYAIAHKANGAATLSDGVISFPDEKVTHSFWYSGSFTPSTTSELSCRMNRIVGMFRLETTDAVPDEVTKFRFLIPQTCTRWAVTGAGAHPVDRVSDVSVGSRKPDGTAAFSLYIIGSATQTTYDITVQALDANNTVVQQRIIGGVPIRNNYKTNAVGAFFIDSQHAFSFVSADWETHADIAF